VDGSGECRRYFRHPDRATLTLACVGAAFLTCRRRVASTIVNIPSSARGWLVVGKHGGVGDVKYCGAFRPDASLPLHVPPRRPARVVSTLTRRYFAAISWFRCSTRRAIITSETGFPSDEGSIGAKKSNRTAVPRQLRRELISCGI
jgi:hypothetical protein